MKQILNRMWNGSSSRAASRWQRRCRWALWNSPIYSFLFEVGARGAPTAHTKNIHTQILFTIQLATVNTAVITGGNQMLNPSVALQCVQVPNLIPCPGMCARETPSALMGTTTRRCCFSRVCENAPNRRHGVVKRFYYNVERYLLVFSILMEYSVIAGSLWKLKGVMIVLK